MNISEAIVDSIAKSKLEVQERNSELNKLLKEKREEHDELLLSHESLVRMLESRDDEIETLKAEINKQVNEIMFLSRKNEPR